MLYCLCCLYNSRLHRKGGVDVFEFLVSTAASVVGGVIAYYVCKAIDGSNKK